jgi:RNA polymerase sigma-70 factor (sigma-E family)
VSSIETADDFAEFVHANWAMLMTIASSVASSRGDAEDLVQTALTGAYARWSRIRRADALAYVRRSILNAHVSRWRRHRGAELVTADVPDLGAAAATGPVDDRLTVVRLLRTLPPRQRAVLVLRYLCDLPDDDIARTLRIAPGTVRSQALRGLATLRAANPSGPLTLTKETP